MPSIKPPWPPSIIPNNRQPGALLVLGFAFSVLVSAQTFDAATFKLSDPNITSGDIVHHGLNLYMRNISMGWILQWAFNLQRYQLSGPDWMFWRKANDQPRFEIMAKGEDSKAHRVMLQNLLYERIGLRFHWEERIRNAIVVRVGPTGFHASKSNDESDQPAMQYHAGVFEFTNATMLDLCDEISRDIDMPLVDATDLKEQRFDGSMPVSMTPDDYVQPILRSLQKYLGLSLKESNVPIRTFVVDGILQKPLQP